jgi:aminoglycoside phosphotransferase (APT) family kinase protein
MLDIQFSHSDARARYYRACVQTLASWMSQDGYVGPESASLKQQRRLTHQYISALVRAGFPTSTRELDRACDWLIRSTDTGGSSAGAEYYVVPDKIEAAIEMGRSSDDFCRMAIDLLLKRRSPGAYAYTIPGEAPNAFLALWAAKIFVNFIDRSDCTAAVDEVLDAFSGHYHTLQARDLALLVHLWAKRYKPRSLANQPMRAMLETLTERCREGFFDANDEVLARLPDLLASGLTLDTTAGIRREVYWSLLSTCYVVENLTRLSSKSKDLAAKVRYSGKQLFRVLGGSDAGYGGVFEPYQQIMLAARSLIAFVSVTGEDAAKLIIPGMLIEIVDRERQLEFDRKQQEKLRLQRVIKEWMNVDWANEDAEKLGGGLSGATVVRIRPRLRIPSDAADGYVSVPVPHIDSIIVKYARKTDLDRERRSYASIPPEFRTVAAAIPSRAHNEVVGDEVLEYLVIEDLRGYRTMQEILPRSSQDFRAFLASRMAEFLKFFYSMPSTPAPTVGATRKMYLTPIYRSLDIIQTLKERMGRVDEADREALDCLRRLLDAADILDNFPHTVMHGDLNSRNLLVHGRMEPGSELHFKLIDLDAFTRSGDMAYDLGEFVADVEEVFRKHHEEASRELRSMVAAAFEQYASDRGDARFVLRFHLAKARSLLKLSEISAKQGLQFAGSDPISDRQVQSLCEDASTTAARAYELLRIAVDGVDRVRG